MSNIKSIQDKLNEGRQYRDFAGLQQIAEKDDKTVEGYATTFDEPYVLFTHDNVTVREQLDAHAFDETDLSDVIMQYNHEGRVFARGSNGTLRTVPDEHGLKIEARLGGTELGRQLYEEIAGGYTTKMSFGFKVGEDRMDVVEDKETGKVDALRTITRIDKLFDVSAVSLPANDATSISARSYGEGVISGVMEEIRKRHDREEQIDRIKKMLEVNYDD